MVLLENEITGLLFIIAIYLGSIVETVEGFAYSLAFTISVEQDVIIANRHNKQSNFLLFIFTPYPFKTIRLNYTQYFEEY